MADDIDAIRERDEGVIRRGTHGIYFCGSAIDMNKAFADRHTLVAALDELQERFEDKCGWLTRMTRERDEARAEVERLFVEGQQAKRERSQHVAWLDDAKVMIATLEAEVERYKARYEERRDVAECAREQLNAKQATCDTMREAIREISKMHDLIGAADEVDVDVAIRLRNEAIETAYRLTCAEGET